MPLHRNQLAHDHGNGNPFTRFFLKPFAVSPKNTTFAPAKSPQAGKQADSLAQSVEHFTFNEGVSGSNPERVTKKENIDT